MSPSSAAGGAPSKSSSTSWDDVVRATRGTGSMTTLRGDAIVAALGALGVSFVVAVSVASDGPLTRVAERLSRQLSRSVSSPSKLEGVSKYTYLPST